MPYVGNVSWVVENGTQYLVLSSCTDFSAVWAMAVAANGSQKFSYGRLDMASRRLVLRESEHWGVPRGRIRGRAASSLAGVGATGVGE